MVGCGADDSKALGKHESYPKEQFFFHDPSIQCSGWMQSRLCQSKSFSFHHPVASGSRRLFFFCRDSPEEE